jgi:tight adherence protein B
VSRTRVIAGAVAALCTALIASGATAATPGFTVVEAGNAPFPNRAFVITLDRKAQLATGDVTVTENGKPVEGTAVQTAASAAGIGTVLLIDTSKSMKGKIVDAMAAARAFAARNPGQPLSVVTFDKVPRVKLPFTTDKKQIKAALQNTPKLALGTVMFDALAAAVAQIRDSGLAAGRVVLLSDGEDVGSTTSKDSAISQLDDQNVRVFSVGIKSPAFRPFDLDDVAQATGGTYAEAGSGQLTGIYDALGYRLSNEYVLVYRSPAAPGKKVKVEVAIAGAPEAQTLSYTTPETGNGAPYERSVKDRILQSWWLLLLVVVLFVVLLVYTVRTLLRLRTNRKLVSRLGGFVTLPEEERARERRSEVTDMLAEPADRARWREWQWFRGLAEDMDVARIEKEPQTLVVWSLLGGLVVAVVLGALAGPLWALLGLLVPLGVRWEVGRRASRTRKEFSEQLPDNLEVMASALRSGHSLVGAMNVVVDESPEPSRREFRKVVTDEQLGIPLDEALEVTAQRMKSSDLDQVAVVALLQREAGGNMAEVLDQVIANIRARMELRRLIQVLTAQGRLARWIITAIPLALLLFLLLVNPEHLQPLFHTTTGQIGMVFALCGMVGGSLVIKRIVEFEV